MPNKSVIEREREREREREDNIHVYTCTYTYIHTNNRACNTDVHKHPHIHTHVHISPTSTRQSATRSHEYLAPPPPLLPPPRRSSPPMVDVGAEAALSCTLVKKTPALPAPSIGAGRTARASLSSRSSLSSARLAPRCPVPRPRSILSCRDALGRGASACACSAGTGASESAGAPPVVQPPSGDCP